MTQRSRGHDSWTHVLVIICPESVRGVHICHPHYHVITSTVPSIPIPPFCSPAGTGSVQGVLWYVKVQSDVDQLLEGSAPHAPYIALIDPGSVSDAIALTSRCASVGSVHTVGPILYLGCIVLGCTDLGCTVLGCTVLGCTDLGCTVLGCTVLGCTVPGCTVVSCDVRCYSLFPALLTEITCCL